MKKGIGFYVLILLVTALFISVSYLIMISAESGKILAVLFSEIGYGFVIFFTLVFWPDKEEEPVMDYIAKDRTLVHVKHLNEQLEIALKKKEYEIYKLKNPLPLAKFKVGQRAGNLVIRSIGEDNSYTCFDADGKVQGCFREEDIELLMKLNTEKKQTS
ncbi:hypothetical protein D4R42_00870 [bacterium]|nr:MAG: hypothetical protein D4R42_00870 [bacterium]